MKLTSTRTCLEVRVGTFHSAELVLHVRRDDLRWFNGQHAAHTQQLFSLLQHHILPRMFGTELEVSHARQSGKPLPPPLGPGGIPIEVGEVNLKRQQQQQTKKRKRQLSKKQLAAELQRQQENANKTKKDVYYAFGSSLQLAYRLADEPKRKPPATLVFGSSQSSDAMQPLIKLSKRVILWCYPHDPKQPLEPDPPGGLHRPEMISLADLFRMPQEEKQDEEVRWKKKSLRGFGIECHDPDDRFVSALSLTHRFMNRNQ